MNDTLKTYHVTWEIDLDAESHEDAARQALKMHRDPTSTATVFGVTEDSNDPMTNISEITIDLDELDNQREAAEQGPQQ